MSKSKSGFAHSTAAAVTNFTRELGSHLGERKRGALMAAVSSSPSSNELRLSQSKLPAAKVLVGPLARRVRQVCDQNERRLSVSEANTFSLEMTPSSSFTFSRIWVQGLIVDRGGVDSFVLDDGTGLIVVDFRAIPKNLARRGIEYTPPELGQMVLAIGKVLPLNDKIRKLTLKAHKVVVIEDPNREALWNAETLQLFRQFQK